MDEVQEVVGMTSPEITDNTVDRDQAVIKVEGVSRWFGNVVSVSDVSFEIKPGITGLLGPNGAGKQPCSG